MNIASVAYESGRCARGSNDQVHSSKSHRIIHHSYGKAPRDLHVWTVVVLRELPERLRHLQIDTPSCLVSESGTFIPVDLEYLQCDFIAGGRDEFCLDNDPRQR